MPSSALVLAMATSRWHDPSDGFEIHCDPKNDLVAFVQRKIGRDLQVGDIAYESAKSEGKWQATCKVSCLDPPEEAAGELEANVRDAEHAAAKQVLLAHADEIAVIQAAKRKAEEETKERRAKKARGEDLGESVRMNKKKLKSALQQLLDRETEATDFVFECSSLDDGSMQSTLALPALSAVIPASEGQAFVGDPALLKEDAKWNACATALAWIQSMPQAAKLDLSPERVAADNPPQPNQEKKVKPGSGSSGKGKGKGKGAGGAWGKGPPPMMEMMAGMMMASMMADSWSGGSWTKW